MSNPRRIPSILVIIALICGTMVSCTGHSAANFDPDYWPTQGWRSSTPEEQGMDSVQLVRMFEYIEDNNITLHSLLIVRNGYLVTEAYWHPYGPNDVHAVESITKSVIGTLIGIAIDRGEIISTDQVLLDFFPDGFIKNLDADKESITLDHLLSMTPGLDCEDTKALNRLDHATDWAQYFLDLPMSSKPGETWVYCSGAAHLLSVVLQSETGMDARTYANRNLFEPLGIPQIPEQDWTADLQGNTNGIAGLYLTPRDLAKYGFLYLNKGKWGDVEIVSSSWVKESTREQAYIGNDDYVGGLDRRFGYLWSIFPDQKYYGYLGRGGQELFILPRENMVIVFTGALRMGDEGSLLKLINEYIIPSVRSKNTIPPNRKADSKLEYFIQKAQGVEQPVPTLPQMASDISGKTYKLESNFLNWLDMTFQFEPGTDEAILKMTNSPNLTIGLDNRYRLTEMPNGRPIGLRGQWVELNVFYLDYIISGDFIRSEAWIQFEGDEIKIKINYLNWDSPLIILYGDVQK